MQIDDVIYGKVNIEEKILIEIIQSPSFQRLKDISQAGVPTQFNRLESYSRYEHSLGVMILLKKLGASIEEQIAGLLHDISHLTFSHVAEWALVENGHEDESYNESLTGEFIKKSELFEILTQNNFNPEIFYSFKKFKLLKREKPLLNADRVDYGFRDINKYIDQNLAQSLVNKIKSNGEDIYFENLSDGKKFALSFLRMQEEYYGSFDAAMRYKLLSEIIKIGLKSGFLTIEDLHGVETPLILKIENSDDKQIKEYVRILKEENLEKYIGLFNINIKKKFRYLIPMVRYENKLVRLDKIDKNLAKKVEAAKSKNDQGVLL